MLSHAANALFLIVHRAFKYRNRSAEFHSWSVQPKKEQDYMKSLIG